jgi:hypothetical protein
VRDRYLEQVEAVEPHPSISGSVVEARWRWIGRAESLLKNPFLRAKEAWYRMVLWHSTEDFRARPVPEQVVGAIAFVWSGVSQVLNGRQDVPPTAASFDCGCAALWGKAYTT